MVSFSTVKLIVSPFHHFTIFLVMFWLYHGIIWNYMELGSKTWSKHLRLQWYCLAIHHTACSKGALCDCASFFIPPTFEGGLDLTVLAFLNCVLGVARYLNGVHYTEQSWERLAQQQGEMIRGTAAHWKPGCVLQWTWGKGPLNSRNLNLCWEGPGAACPGASS